MKLNELTHVSGENGGMHSQMDDAIKNMTHHSKNHTDKRIRALAKTAVSSIKRFQQLPHSAHDDPHTFVKALSCMTGEPDHAMLTSAVSTIGSYVESDHD